MKPEGSHMGCRSCDISMYSQEIPGSSSQVLLEVFGDSTGFPVPQSCSWDSMTATGPPRGSIEGISMTMTQWSLHGVSLWFLVGFSECHVYHCLPPKFWMVGIPPIKMVMTGGCFVTLLYHCTNITPRFYCGFPLVKWGWTSGWFHEAPKKSEAVLLGDWSWSLWSKSMDIHGLWLRIEAYKETRGGNRIQYPLVIKHSCGKSPCFMGQSTINGNFQ